MDNQNFGLIVYLMVRLGNLCVRVSVFGSKSCVFLAVCGQIWQKILGTQVKLKVQSIPLIVPAVGPPKNWHYSRFGTISDIFVNKDSLTYE